MKDGSLRLEFYQLGILVSNLLVKSTVGSGGRSRWHVW